MDFRSLCLSSAFCRCFIRGRPVLICAQQTGAKVEKAFMSHAEDEEKLADPAFRQLMAEKIYEGIVDYLKETDLRNRNKE